MLIFAVACAWFATRLRAADDPVLQRARELAGTAAKDCGGSSPGATSEPCLVRAFTDHTPAFWVSHTHSAISPTALAYVVGSSGTLTLLTRNRPTDRLDEYRCVEPVVVRAFGKQRLRCKERYVAPAGFDETPFRVSGDITPPQLTQALTVPSRLCTVTPGTSLKVDFVVGRDGRVRMVDILGAPEDCDVPATAAALEKVAFRPATLSGSPVTALWFMIVWKNE
ncbi:MAG TPA: hypothetical protein VJZ00_12610 [Thermoanaerobaculia bacterium]|nr:hypothetical protein [Thermoanaerobaculia bacterium]